MNWTAPRTIYFADTNSSFNYNNRTDIELWLKTNVSAETTITRKLINWNQSLMQWNDSASPVVTARYNITGLKEIRTYYIYNNSELFDTLTTDVNGVLPSFTIYLSSEHEVKVEETEIDITPPQIEFIPPTDDNNSYINRDWSYVNVSIQDASNTSSFIDWNYSLVGYWAMDWYNSSGIFDNSTYNNFGTFNGGLGPDNITTGKYGYGLEFDGVDNYVSIPLSSGLDITGNEITVEAWVKPIGNNTYGYRWQHLIDNYDGYWLDILGESQGDRNFSFRVKNSVGANTFADGITQAVYGNWYHVVGIVNTTNVLLYVNGTLEASPAFTGNLNSTGNPFLLLGRYRNFADSDFNFNGSLDEVRIYKRILSPEEINASYNKGLYRLYHNFTDLEDGQYEYYAYAIDAVGNANKTETRYLTVKTNPLIEFIDPTPENDTHTNKNYTYVNVSVSGIRQTSSFIDWNRSLVGYWSMDWYNSSGIFDNSTYNNFGTFNGGLGTDNITTGKYGYGLEFDGDSTSHIQVPDSDSLDVSSITISLWLKFADNQSSRIHTILNKKKAGGSGAGGYTLYISESGRMTLDVWNETDGCYPYSNKLSWDKDVWYFVAVTYDGNTGEAKFYRNDSSVGTDTEGCKFITPTNKNLNISTPSYPWNGTLDEIRIFNRALSEEKINASYNSGLYRLYHNFTDLEDGQYEYYAYAIDTIGNTNKTETRYLTVDSTLPQYCDVFISTLPKTIDQNNTYYCLAKDMKIAGQTAIDFTSGVHNTTLDCLGYNLDGNDASLTYGVYLTGSNENNTIKNCNITDFYYGIELSSATNNTLTSNILSSCDEHGIGLASSSCNILVNNTADFNTGSSGIYLSNSDNNTLTKNSANSNRIGIVFSSSDYNTLNNNTANSNTESGFHLGGFSDYNTLNNNTAKSNLFGVYFNIYPKNNAIIGGSIFKNTRDIYLGENAGNTNYFRDINFTDSRTIQFYEQDLWFNYNNDTENGVWLNTSLKATGRFITRKLIDWNQSLMKWNDSASSAVTARYNISGLKESRIYYVYNNSELVDTLTTDANGVLPSFTIYLSSEHEVKVQEDPVSPQIEFIDPTDDNNSYINRDWSYVNVSIEDASNTSSFIDWNRSLVGYWKFESVNASNYTLDFTDYNNDGYVNTSGEDVNSKIVSGKFGKGLYFDGLGWDSGGDIVKVDDHDLPVTSKGTIEVWFKPGPGFDGSDALVMKGDLCTDCTSCSDIDFLINRHNIAGPDYGSIKAFISDSIGQCDVIYTNTKNFTVGRWYHIAFTWNGTHRMIYVNGTLETGPLSQTKSANPSSRPLYFGAITVNRFNGTMDEVRIWNRALSPEEINASYNSGLHRLYHNFTDLEDGQYEYYAYAIDTVGNTNQTETRILTVDTTPPQWSDNKTSPSSGTTYYPGKSYQFNVTCNDNIGMYNAWLTFDENNYQMNNESSEYYYTLTDLAAGSYSYNFTCNDTSGNTNTTDTWTYGINKAKPVLVMSNATAEVNTSGLVGYWKFDEGIGTKLRDSSGYGNNGTISGGSNEWVTGKFGQALEFHGSDTHAGNDASLNPSDAITVEAWIKFDTLDFDTQYPRILSRVIDNYNRTEFYYDNSTNPSTRNKIYGGFRKFNTPYVVGTLKTDWIVGEWYHVTWTYDKDGGTNNMKIYVNGLLNNQETESPPGGTMPTDTADFYIGSYDGSGSFLKNTTLDEIRIWNRSLTADEIKELYESRVMYSTQTNFSLSEQNQGDSDVYYDFFRNGTVVGIWHFDEGEGNYTFDDSGNNNTGILENSTHGVPQWKSGSDCKYGSCLEFDGEGDYVEVPYNPVLNVGNYLTLEVWFFPKESKQQSIVDWRTASFGNRYILSLSDSGNLQGSLGLTGGNIYPTAINAIDIDQWYYAVLVWNGTHGNLYIDGTLADSVPGSGSISTNDQPLFIASRNQTARFFNGTIDEVKIYPRALSPEEVLCRYGNNCTEAGFNNETVTLGTGYHYYVTRASEGQNYSSSSLLLPLNVSGDTEPPQWFDNSTNNTIVGKSTLFSLRWTDNVNLSSYVFSLDNCTGSLQNVTETNFPTGGTEDWSNETYVINDTVGCEIRWCVYANDTNDNWNATSCDDPFTLITWGWSNVSWISPDDGDYVIGDIITLNCTVLDANTSNPIPNYPVKFYNETDTASSLIGANLTDSSGYAIYSWNTSDVAEGTYYPKCNITDNSTLYYNVSVAEDNTTITLSSNQAPKIWNLVVRNFYNDNPITETATGVWVNITVNVSDSDNNLDYVEANFTWPNGTTVYSNLTLVQGKNYTHVWNYSLPYEMPNGTVIINVTAYDTFGYANTTNTTLTILENIEIVLENTPVNFSSVNPGTETQALQYQGWPLNISVLGNVPVNISQTGEDLIGKTIPSLNIQVGNITWNQTSSGLFSQLTTTHTVVNSSKKHGDYQYIYYKLNVPVVEPQPYGGNLIIKGEQT